MDSMRARIAQEDVNVEVDAARGPELGSVLSELRSQYEGIVQKNKEEAEDWYRKKVSDVNDAVLILIGRNRSNQQFWQKRRSIRVLLI